MVRPGLLLAMSLFIGGCAAMENTTTRQAVDSRSEGPRRFASVQVNREESEILGVLHGAGFEVVERRPMFVVMIQNFANMTEPPMKTPKKTRRWMRTCQYSRPRR